jgi:uncharacterized repeat protein (TIGR01451 family)
MLETSIPNYVPKSRQLAGHPFRTTAIAVLVCTLTGFQSAAADSDPITTSHPVWFIPQGAAKIDGTLEEAEWRNAFEIVRTQAWRRGRIRVRMLHDAQGIYLATETDDEYLWADGQGGGAGNRWEVETDDSVTFYFDPNRSRNQFFQEGDRAFGVNLGNPADPLNGGGAVRRWKFVKGNGAGGAPDVLPGGTPADGTLWASTYRGSLNNTADRDGGWSTEIFLPWAALNLNSPPIHGDTIGMNFDVIFDNDGNGRNFADNRDGPNRFTLPAFVDDHIQGAHSSYAASQAGIQGPVNYAEAMFLYDGAADRPAAVADLKVQQPSAYGAILAFTAPAGAGGGKGHVASYDIRVSTTPITDETAWNAATSIAHRHVPQPRGEAERLRIAGLAPATAHHVAVRARDFRGALGALGGSVAFTTGSKTAAADKGRIIPAPNGSGLMFEDGTPFVPVGEHLGMSWGYFRQLFPGGIWEPVSKQFLNYSAPGIATETPVGTHLANLQAKGVNTLRVFLEILAQNQTGNTFGMPNGRYWLEFPAASFNPDLKAFVLKALEEAAARDMYLVFSPFDTFTWNSVFAEETPWAKANGGPLDTIDDFFQNPSTLEQAKSRLRQVIAWVNESPHKNHLIGWESLNEWDSTGWTRNAEGNGEPGRETEMRRRSLYVQDLNRFIREQDPNHLVISSTTARDPRGPLARAVFYDRSIDVLAPHFYTNSSEEPHNNPQAHKEVLPAEENALLGNYWITHRNDRRPLLNGEWGLTRSKWPGGKPAYGAAFTQAQDEAQFRTIAWSGVATGQAGQGLRITTDELEGNLNSLTDGMRAVEQKMAAVFGNALPQSLWRDYAAETLEGGIQVFCQGGPGTAATDLKAFGTHSGYTGGLLYLLLDNNRRDPAACPSPAQSQLVLNRFPSFRQYTAQVWTTTGGDASPLKTQETPLSTGRQVSFDLSGALADNRTDAVLVFRQGTAAATGAPVPLAIDKATGQGTAHQPAQKTCQSATPRCDYHYSFVPTASGPQTVTLNDETGCFQVYDTAGTVVAQSGRAATGACGAGNAPDTARFTAKQGEEYFVLVAVEGASSGNHSLSVAGEAALAGDLALTLTGGQNPAATGGRVTYTASVSNAGTQTATGVQVAVTLPGGANLFYSAAGCARNGNQLTCHLGDLAPGAGSSVRFAVTPTAAGTLEASARVSSALADGNAGNDSASVQTTVKGTAKRDRTAANLQAALTGAGTLKAKRAARYRLKVKNLGPAPAEGVEVLATLPAGAAFASPDPRCTPVAEGLLCALGTLAKGRTAAVSTSLVFGAPAKAGYSATATALPGDPVPRNNAAKARLNVRK